MLKEEKGITAGTATLIVAIVAAGMGGGLYLFTHFGDSENTSIISENEAVSEAMAILAESGVQPAENLVLERAELRPPTEAEENVIESEARPIGDETVGTGESEREAPNLIWKLKFSRPDLDHGGYSLVVLLDPHSGENLTLIQVTV